MNASVVLAMMVVVQGIGQATGNGSTSAPAAATALELHATPLGETAVERVPLALRLVLTNKGAEPAPVYFKRGEQMLVGDLFCLRAVDERGRESVVHQLQLLTHSSVRAAGFSLGPGEAMATDHLMCLKVDAPDLAPAGGGVQNEGFLRPGRYRVRAVLTCPPVVVSNEFELVVVPAMGSDARALALFPALPYYAEGDARMPESKDRWAFGGSVEEVRAKLEEVMRECPDSALVRWVKYWHCWHALDVRGSAKQVQAARDALAFAESNKTMPLVDRLMLRAAKRLATGDEPQQARAVLEAIRRDFPSSTCSADEMRAIEREAEENGAAPRP